MVRSIRHTLYHQEYLVTEYPPVQAEQVVQEAVEPVNLSPAYVVKEIEPSVYVVEKKSKKKKSKKTGLASK